jgi:hypothetical protein
LSELTFARKLAVSENIHNLPFLTMTFVRVFLGVAAALRFVATSAFDTPDVFPASTRAALAAKSGSLNPSQGYTTAGWSNRAATVLTPVHLDPNVYTGDRPFYWNRIDVGCRMTVIELPADDSTSGRPDLWVHSPVGLDGPMQQALNQLGNVKYVVSPNYEHLKFAAQWYQSFPQADMWGCPGLAQRMENIQWKGEIPDGFRPTAWKGGPGTQMEPDSGIWDTNIIQPLHIDIEKNPFTGKPFFNEVVYYHQPSKTLLCTDLFWNYPADVVPNSQYGADDTWELAPRVAGIPVGSRLWKFGMDQIYRPFFNNFMVTDQSQYRDVVNHILDVWDVETLIPAHGDILRGRTLIRQALREHFQLD